MADEATLDFGQSTPAGRAAADAEEARRRRALLGLVVQQAAAAQPAAAAPPGPPGPDMQSAPDTQPSAAEQARNPNLRPNPLAGLTPGRISGYTGDIPGMPAISDGTNPVPNNMAALFAGRGGYVSPERGAGGAVAPNANGVLASRELPERRLGEAEYNSLLASSPRSPNGAFPSFASTQPGGVNSTVARGAVPTGNTMLDNLTQSQSTIDALVGPRPTFQSHGMGYEDAPTRDWEQRRAALLNNVHSGALISGNVAQQAADTNRASVDNAGSPAQLAADAAGRALVREAEEKLEREHPQLSPAARQAQAAADAGMPLDRADRLMGRHVIRQLATPAPGAVAPAAGAVVTPPGAGVDARGASTQTNQGTSNTFAGIQRQLDEASGHVAAVPQRNGAAAVAEVPFSPGMTPGAFVNKLEVNNPGMVAQNLPAIRNYMISRFGESATERAMQMPREGSPLQQIGYDLRTLGERFRGSSEEDRGMSGLRNLQRTINAFPGRNLEEKHAAWLRSQGPTPGSPPLPGPQ